MATRTLEDQVDAILTRSVVEPRRNGLQDPATEASSVFDQIVLSLLSHPRAVLYLAFLARNGLRKAIQDEIDLVDVLKEAVRDLANPSYRIDGTSVLERARSSLLQLQGLPRLTADSVQFQRFSNSVQEFLEKHLSKNVRRPGATKMTRPAEEAVVDVQKGLGELKTQHAALLERLYLLSVGVENFLSAPMSALLGAGAAARARADLDEVIEHVRSGGAPAAARDIATRLIGSRAALRLVGSLPTPFDVQTATIAARGAARSAPSHWALPAGGAGARVTDGTADITWVTPNPGSLFLPSRRRRVGAPTLAGTLYLQVGSDVCTVPVSGPVGDLDAAARAATGGRVSVLVVDGVELIFVSSTTAKVLGNFTDSAHSALGFTNGQTASAQLAIEDARALLDSIFGSAFDVSISGVAPYFTLYFTSRDPTPGAVLHVDAPWLGISGSFKAQTNEFDIDGDARELMESGDTVSFAGTTVTVASVSRSSFTTAETVDSYAGVATISNSLATRYKAFEKSLATFLAKWVRSSYAEDLSSIDIAISRVLGSRDQAQINQATQELEHLSSTLAEMSGALVWESSPATKEKDVVDSIAQVLSERKFDRALDLLMKCDVQVLLELDADSASYAGNLLKSISSVANGSLSKPVGMKPSAFSGDK